eukprot:TRINITY_DN62600_c0_g1_i1.p1 TRINITY_DN62600_c0_g1~~TRINITY_DN62600_c0_g1_i1.p1  ORF type:complete len:754 (-),score=156.02 TRINITY_DN62600_c0_g1_i1:6-2267(-)
MGKQGAPNAALFNALRTSGKAAAPPVKEKAVVQEKRDTGSWRRSKKEVVEEPAPRTRKDIEESQRRVLQENERKKEAFYAEEAATKSQAKKSADTAFTYVEDKDTRKPRAVGDISDFWVKDLKLLPFLPTDNVADLTSLDDSANEELDPNERPEYLRLLNEQLAGLLRLRFHIFWSQVFFDKQVLRFLDSYLRFAIRTHDMPANANEIAGSGCDGTEDAVEVEERQLFREVSARVLAVLVRLSRPQETSHDFFTSEWYGREIQERRVFDVPKLIDICAIYGDSNREVVTRLVHSVFTHQPDFKTEFRDVVEHILGGLHQCCGPLQQATGKSSDDAQSELRVSDCLVFLPDILTCFNAIFCFFPEDCVALLLGGDVSDRAKSADEPSLPLAELMVTLHEAVGALEARSGSEAHGSDIQPPQFATIRRLLCRLLSLTLGFKMAPRHGADAFAELLGWLQQHSEMGDLLQDLGRNGLDNLAMDWLASSLVDDAQLDFLEALCGPVLGAEARSSHARRRDPVAPGVATTSASSTKKASTTAATGREAAKPSNASANDSAKIREVREVVGSDYGDGFLLQCLLHYGGSVPAVVGAILDGSLPPQIAALPVGMRIGEDPMSVGGAWEPALQRALSREDKQRIMVQADAMGRKAAEDAEYDDDYDDTGNAGANLNVDAGDSDLNDSDEEDNSSGEDESWRGQRGKGGYKGQKGGKGGGGKGKGSVKGQTIQARRKEENKSAVANHHRRDRAWAKMRKGMM